MYRARARLIQSFSIYKKKKKEKKKGRCASWTDFWRVKFGGRNTRGYKYPVSSSSLLPSLNIVSLDLADLTVLTVLSQWNSFTKVARNIHVA